jgi:hypothetical protein
LDACRDGLTPAKPKPAYLVVGDNEDLARTPLEVQETQNGRETELLEAAAQPGID